MEQKKQAKTNRIAYSYISQLVYLFVDFFQFYKKKIIYAQMLRDIESLYPEYKSIYMPQTIKYTWV